MELALYRGDEFVGLFDSYKEVAEFLGIRPSTARCLSAPSRYGPNRLKLYNYEKHDYKYYEDKLKND